MNRLKLLSVTFLALLVASPRVSHSQTTVNSDPVGFVTTTVRAGLSNGFSSTMISPVLTAPPADLSGSLSGTLTSVASNTLIVSPAGWTNNELSARFSHIMLTDGPQSGLILRITANTSNTITVNTFGLNLSGNGVATGQKYQLLGGDTLISFFGVGTTTGLGTNGATAVLGGTEAQFNNRETDQVLAVDSTGVLRSFYYNTAAGQWRRIGTSANQNNTPISPIAGVLYQRRATIPLSLLQTGTVPAIGIKHILPGNGTVFMGRFFPTDGTISSFGLQNLPGWAANDDRLVAVDSLGIQRAYTWNSTFSQWRRVGSSANQGNVPVPAGSAVYTQRTGKAPLIVPVSLPYSL